MTDPTVREANMDEYLDKAMAIAANRNITLSGSEKLNDDIFKNSYIPLRMDDVVDFERDFRRAKHGETLIYTTLHGIKHDLSTPRLVPALLDEQSIAAGDATAAVNSKQTTSLSNGDKQESENVSKQAEVNSASEDDSSEGEDEDGSEDESSGDDDEDEEEEDEPIDEAARAAKAAKAEIHFRPRDESPNSKRERKHAVKEEKREKRKQKTPKHVKKRAIKVTKVKKS